jgi:hypothetical protein
MAEVVEFVGIERDGDRLDAVTEDDRGNAAGFAQERNRLTGLCAAAGGEYCRG